MRHRFTVADLEMYLDEAMPPEEMVRVELALRDDPELAGRLAAINGRRDAGIHSLGEIWRRHRLTCPTREQLGSHLLGALPPELDDYIRFHIATIGCRWCRANLTDLKRRQDETPDTVETRRRRYFQSSVGHLKK